MVGNHTFLIKNIEKTGYIFLLICGPLEDVKQDIENRTFALPEMEKKKSREREYIEWSSVNVSTVNGDINYDEYFRLAD